MTQLENGNNQSGGDGEGEGRKDSLIKRGYAQINGIINQNTSFKLPGPITNPWESKPGPNSHKWREDGSQEY